MVVIVGNLPEDVSREDINALFHTEQGIESIKVMGREQGINISAIVDLHANRATAERTAARINGMYWHGRSLQAYVPLFMQPH